MPVDLNMTVIDPADPALYTLLEDLQGNILKSHGRDNALHIFIQFTAPPAEVRAWMKEFAEKYVTSAMRQLALCEIYRKDGTCGGLFGSLLLTAAGYRALGYSDEEMPRNASFQRGQQAMSPSLNDPLPETWDDYFREEIHALILLADDQAPRLFTAAERVRKRVSEVARILHVEAGGVYRNVKGQAIEHFGFVDGASQPLFLRRDVEEASSGGTDCYDPAAPLNLALARDPLGKTEDSFGSYLVYRKLEQDTYLYAEKERELAKLLGVDTELAGAYAMGRFRDGTPIVDYDKPASLDGVPNNFNYQPDPQAARCPFQSHVRKSNPRGESGKPRERARRIIRRGISYGPHLRFPPKDDPGGLLFMCYQSDITEQFEYIQIVWNNACDFMEAAAGLDPVIGQGQNTAQGQKWRPHWGDPAQEVRFDFSGTVKMRGGEYFFAPSLSFLMDA